MLSGFSKLILVLSSLQEVKWFSRVEHSAAKWSPLQAEDCLCFWSKTKNKTDQLVKSERDRVCKSSYADTCTDIHTGYLSSSISISVRLLWMVSCLQCLIFDFWKRLHFVCLICIFEADIVACSTRQRWYTLSLSSNLSLEDCITDTYMVDTGA